MLNKHYWLLNSLSEAECFLIIHRYCTFIALTVPYQVCCLLQLDKHISLIDDIYKGLGIPHVVFNGNRSHGRDHASSTRQHFGMAFVVARRHHPRSRAARRSKTIRMLHRHRMSSCSIGLHMRDLVFFSVGSTTKRI